MKKKSKGIVGLDAATAVILILSFLVSLYLSAITDCAMGGESVPWNPFSAMAYIMHNGVSGTTVAVLFILLSLCGLYFRKNGIGSKDGLQDDRNFKYSESDVYGTAGYLKPTELDGFALITNPDDADGTILGQMDKTGERLITTDMDSFNNKHVAICGGSGAGKSRSYARPFIIQAVKRRESIVVTDPKGELYEDTAQYMRDHGYIVRIFNTKTPTKSDPWNCLRELLGSDYRAQIFSSVVIENTESPKDIWKSAKASLLKALCLRVVRGSDFGDNVGCIGPKTMESVYKLITLGSDAVDALFDEQLLSNVGAISALQPYQIYLKNSTNGKASVVASLGNSLQSFQGRDVCKMTATDDIDLTLPAQKPCAYYCVMSDQHQTMDFFASLFFSFLFIDLVDYIDENGVENCIPVNFLLDEFPNIGEIPDFDRKIATVRSRNINISLIFQGLPQLQARYPDGKWSTIIGNCDTVLFLGTGFDPETAEFFSSRTGDVTVKVKTEQHGKIDPLVRIGFKHSTGDGKRVLLTPDEIIRLERDRCIIIFSRENVMRAFKYDYTLHPEASNFKKCRIKDIPDIFDDEARANLRREDEKRVKDYEEYLKANPPRTKSAKKRTPVNTSSTCKNIIGNLINAIKDYVEKKSWKLYDGPAGLLEEAGKRITMLLQDNPVECEKADTNEEYQFQQAANPHGANIEIIDGVIYEKDTNRRVGYLDGNVIHFDDTTQVDDDVLVAEAVVEPETWSSSGDETSGESQPTTLGSMSVCAEDSGNCEEQNPANPDDENAPDSQEIVYTCPNSDGSVSSDLNATLDYGSGYNGDDFEAPDLPAEDETEMSNLETGTEKHCPVGSVDPRDSASESDDVLQNFKVVAAKAGPQSQHQHNLSHSNPNKTSKTNGSHGSQTRGCVLDGFFTGAITPADIEKKMAEVELSSRGKRRG